MAFYLFSFAAVWNAITFNFMRKTVCLSLLFFAAVTAGQELQIEDQIITIQPSNQQPTYLPQAAASDRVLVIYNTNYLSDNDNNGIADGYDIALYYRQARNIPDVNILGVAAPVTEQITRPQFDADFDSTGSRDHLKQSIEYYLETTYDENGVPLKDKIYYIVLTKGIPIKIRQFDGNEGLGFSDYSSVDASLALLFQDYDIDGRLFNPYCNPDPFGSLNFRFKSFHFSNSQLTLSYLVTRLDGYSVDEIKGMIDRSLSPYTSGGGWWVIDDAQKTYDKMYNAYLKLKDLNQNINPDPWVDSADWITTNSGKVAGYVSHGVHAGMPADYIRTALNFDYANGAIFTSYESVNAASFNSFGSQGQVADFIQKGGTGGIGNVYEPGSHAIAREEILFPMYAVGYPLADAAYMSLVYLDWTTIVVGDPLCSIVAPVPDDTSTKALQITETAPANYAENVSLFPTIQFKFNHLMDSASVGGIEISPADGGTWTTLWRGGRLFYFPSQPLNPNTNYTVTIPETACGTEGRILQGNRAITFTTVAITDVDPPQVLYFYPFGGDISTSSPVELIFSEAMNQASVVPLDFSPSISGEYIWISKHHLKFIPDKLLQGTSYNASLNSHASDESGNFNIGIPFSWSFTTVLISAEFDIDEDGETEFACNSDGLALNGFEIFIDTLGYISHAVLSADGDGDLKTDHFIDTNGDSLPDVYWDPDHQFVTSFYYLDDDDDGIDELVFDADGDGLGDKVYDPNDQPVLRDLNFILVSTEPADSGENVSLTSSILLNFSRPVQVSAALDGLNIDPPIIMQSYQVYDAGRSLIIIPEVLQNKKLYQISLDTTAADIYDNQLLHDYSWSFTTRDSSLPDTSHPLIVGIEPVDGAVNVAVDSDINIIFSKGMDTLSVRNAVSVQKFGGDSLINLSFNWQGVTFLSLTHQPFDYGTTYRVSIDTTAVDLSDNPLNKFYQFSFTTEDIQLSTPQITGITLAEFQLGIDWDALDEDVQYEIYYSDAPFFPADDSCLVDPVIITDLTSAAIDLNELGYEQSAYYFRLRSVKGNRFSALTKTVAVYPVSILANESLNENAVSNFIDMTAVSSRLTNSASSIENIIPAASAVSKWIPQTQTWEEATYIENAAIWINDFSIQTGDVIHVKTTQSDSVNLIGFLPDSLEYTFQLPSSEPADFSLALYSDSIRSASALGDNLLEASAVFQWLAEGQGWNEANYIESESRWLNDFSLTFASPVMVRINQSQKIVFKDNELYVTQISESALLPKLNASNSRNISLNIYGKLLNGKGGSVKNDSISFSAEILSLPGKILTESSIGCGTDEDFWFLNAANFEGRWQYGDTLAVDFLNHTKKEGGKLFIKLDKNTGLQKPFQLISSEGQISVIPSSFGLSQNYPNPFNPVTTIRYQIPEIKGKKPKVTLIVYDIMGRKIRTLVDEHKEAGYYSVQWNGKNNRGVNIASGIYFIRMNSGSFIKIRKMAVVK